MVKKQNETTMTRAEKTDAAKKIILKLLKKTSYTSTELIDAAAKEYAKAYENGDSSNDVKGRIGSVLDVMKKDNEVLFEGGRYEMKPAEKPKKRTTKAKKEETEAQEKPVKARKTTKAKKEAEEVAPPVPLAPLQPIAPTAPVTPETAPEPAPKKRGRKPKTEKAEEIKTEEVKTEVKEEVKEEKPQEKTSPQGTLMDISFLLGEVKKPAPATAKEEQKKEEAKPQEKIQEKPQEKKAEKSVPAKAEKPAVKMQKTVQAKQPAKPKAQPVKTAKTADEKLQEAFLDRLHRLGGDYFEYYCVYLLERYSRQNGRRLEMLKVCGGEHDGGVDGEIELTDKLGFRETIYIQAKNWDADKGNKSRWVVGETLLQQFLGACACKQAKDGKQNCRGMFITTSHFTPDAKKLLELMADKLVGYDGADLYETAKECNFGVVKKNGEWALDEDLLSGKNAFFRNF